MKRLFNTAMTFVIIPILWISFSGCSKTEWQNNPPKEFQGTFYQVSEGIIQGYEYPIIVEINSDTFQYTYYDYDELIKKVYPILKVSKTNNEIIIFCGDKNEDYISDWRYEMYWLPDNYLYISEIVSTGYNRKDYEVAYFELGKFTTNKNIRYLKK